MSKYRKKPVVIDAVQLLDDGESIVSAACFTLECDVLSDHLQFIEYVKNQGGFAIPTLEGEMFASFGDYIIKGVNGEFYPCKPDIFAKTYEAVDE